MRTILAAYLKQSTTIIFSVYDRLFNRQCIFCLTSSKSNICPACQQVLPRLMSHCSCCAEPNHHGHICGECLKHPPAFDHTICPFMLQGPVVKLIQRLKRSSKVLGLECLEQDLCDALRPHSFDAILAMPYHWRKRLWRGHQPTQQLAANLSQQLSYPLWQGLIRKKATRSQQGLDKPQRKSNVRNSFACSPWLTAQLKDKNILLIDDVVTTGATAHAAALVLKKQGAKSVTLACLARTPLTHF